MTVKHTKVTAVADDPAYDVGADEWNNDHTISGTSGQVQYNNGGSLTGLPLTFTSATQFLAFTPGDTGNPGGSVLSWDFSSAGITDVTGGFGVTLPVTAGKAFQTKESGDPSAWSSFEYNGGLPLVALGPGTSSRDAGFWRSAAKTISAWQNSGDRIGYFQANAFINNGVAFASLPASPVAGMTAYVTDSNTTTWGATVAGSGANKVLVWYNGTNWTVVGI